MHDLRVRHGRFAVLDPRPAAVQFIDTGRVGYGGSTLMRELREVFRDSDAALCRTRFQRVSGFPVELDSGHPVLQRLRMAQTNIGVEGQVIYGLSDNEP